MDEIIFKPKYEKKIIISFIICFIACILVVYINFIDTNNKPKVIWPLIFSGIVFVTIPYVCYKRILFKDYIKIERYFVGPRIIMYSDIIDIGVSRIKTRKGTISLYRVVNSEEFMQILNKIIQSGIIDNNQIEGKLYEKDLDAYLAQPISIIVSIFVVYLFSLLNINHGHINKYLYRFVLFMSIYLITYFVIRKCSIYIGRKKK